MTIAARFNAARVRFNTFRVHVKERILIKLNRNSPGRSAGGPVKPSGPVDVGEFAPKAPGVSLTKSIPTKVHVREAQDAVRPRTKVEEWIAATPARQAARDLAKNPPTQSYFHLPMSTVRSLILESLNTKPAHGGTPLQALQEFGGLPENFKPADFEILEVELGAHQVGGNKNFTLRSDTSPVVTGINPSGSQVRALGEAAYWETPADPDVKVALTEFPRVKIGYRGKDGAWIEQVLMNVKVKGEHELPTYRSFNPWVQTPGVA